MIFRRTDPPCRYRLIQRVLNDLAALSNTNPNGDFSDSFCICRIVAVERFITFVRVRLVIQPQAGCFNKLIYQPSLYIGNRFPLTSILVFNDRWLYHPNIDLLTKKFAIPKETGQLPNSISFTIKYIKFVCIEPCVYHVPYNLYNMKAALQFQRRSCNE
jgi:hypothetical protein